MDPLARLAAIEEIRQLKARYFRCVDMKDWDGLARVFAPDMAFDRTGASSLYDPWTGAYDPPLPDEHDVVHGRAAAVAMVRRAVERLRTIHQGFMPEIEIVDADHATGIWAMSDLLLDRAGATVLEGRGHYLETYVRGPEGWMIRTAVIRRLWLKRGTGSGPDPLRH